MRRRDEELQYARDKIAFQRITVVVQAHDDVAGRSVHQLDARSDGAVRLRMLISRTCG